MIKLLFFLACVLAVTHAERSQRIHYGRAITQQEVETQYSFVVGIVMRQRGSRMYSTCTGALISPDTVVTAAHCLCGQNLAIEVYYKTAKQMSGQHVSAARFEGNRKFDCSRMRTLAQPHVDIGKIKLARPVPGVKPIALDCRMPTVGSESVGMIGYGLDENKNSGQLKIGTRKTRECARNMRGAICVDTRVGGRDRTDHGDSGGPMIVKSGENVAQVGVVSGMAHGMYTFCAVKDHCRWLRN